jgi:hypothetical protein
MQSISLLATGVDPLAKLVDYGGASIKLMV